MSKINAKNIILILLSAFMVGGSFYIAEKRNGERARELFNDSDSALYGTGNGGDVRDNDSRSIVTSLSSKDSDSDGLKDWEEVLWGTDANNPDSDSDSTSDGREVEQSRNPLKAGPDDKYIGKTNVFGETSTEQASYESLPLTDRLGRDVFARYIELKQAGLSDDPVSQAEIASDIALSGEYFLYPKVYTESEIKKTSDNSKERARVYGNELATAFTSNMITTRNEAVIAQEAINTKNPEKLKEILPIINSYEMILADLLAIEVPLSLVPAHTQVVNGVEANIFSAKSLMQALADPIIGIQGASKLLEAGQTLYTGLLGVKSELSSLGVWYPQGEPGYAINPVQ